MKLVFITVLLLSLEACTQKDFYKSLNTELAINSKLDIDYEEIRDENVIITYPLNLTDNFSSLNSVLCENEFTFSKCPINSDFQQVDIVYDVKYITENFMSMTRSIYVSGCYMSDVLYYDFFNVYYHENEYFKIDINYDNAEKEIDLKKLVKDSFDNDCLELLDYSDFYIDLIFKNGKPVLFGFIDKMCMREVETTIDEIQFSVKSLEKGLGSIIEW